MPNSITVTFGGREWVLEKRGENYWGNPDMWLDRLPNGRWESRLWLHLDGASIKRRGRSSQDAVSAVEIKLRALHSELGRVLGVGKESEHGEA